MGYNCRAMTSRTECGSVWEAQCSSHKIMVHRRRVTAEIFENFTVAYSSSCDCVYCTPSAYELNRQLACKLKCVWNVCDVTSGSVFAAIFHKKIGKWVFHLSDACVCPNHAIYLVFVSNAESVNLTLAMVLKMCELAIVRVKWKKITVAIVMQCGESTLWHPRIFNKLSPSQQLCWSVPNKIAPPHGSLHYYCGPRFPFVPRRFPRCIMPQVWHADLESNSSLWAVTPYPQTMLCAVKGAFTALHHNETWDIYQPTSWGDCAQTPALNLAYNHSVVKHSNCTQPIWTKCMGMGIRVKCFSTSDIFDIRRGLTWKDRSSVMTVSNCI